MSKGTNQGDACFQLKADFFPMTVLKLSDCSLELIQKELQKHVDKAPNYFNKTPIIIDVNDISTNDTLDLKGLCDILREKSIIPAGIRGLAKDAETLATEHGLVIFKTAKPEPVETKPEPAKKTKPVTKGKIVSRPVRAGTREYAKDGDLVVMAAVNSGGEVIADGNIHIYGPLRGRALAGATGNPNARIFCRSLEAELISIAGHYLVNEQIQAPKTKQGMLQIYLQGNKLHIEGI